MRARDLRRRSGTTELRLVDQGPDWVELERITPQFDSAAREHRSAAFVYSVLRRSFPDGPAVARFVASTWPARSGRGRPHSTAAIYEGYLILTHESRGWPVELVPALLKLEGCSPPPAEHKTIGPSLKKWLSRRRAAARDFKAAIEDARGTPPQWLAPTAAARRQPY